MTKFREYLLRAGHDLGITVIAPFALTLRSGKQLSVDAFLPELGASNGMIVCIDANTYLPVLNEITEEGYGCSSFDKPLPQEAYDLESYKGMFLDWSWASKTKPKPSWMD